MGILFWVIVGYCLAVLFPVPWLSQAILNGWKKLIETIKTFSTNKN